MGKMSYPQQQNGGIKTNTLSIQMLYGTLSCKNVATHLASGKLHLGPGCEKVVTR